MLKHSFYVDKETIWLIGKAFDKSYQYPFDIKTLSTKLANTNVFNKKVVIISILWFHHRIWVVII